MRIVWVGFHEEGRYCIPEIYKAGFSLEAIITLDDEQLSKRSGGIDYSYFSELYNVPLYKISHINDDSSLELLSKLSPDVMCVIGWSQILSGEVLSSAELVVGGHASLLPRHRGSAPVNWSIIKGEPFSGNTLMQLQEGVDTGKILAQKSFDITLYDSCKTIYEKVATTNSKMIVDVLSDFESGKLIMQDQGYSSEPLLRRRKPSDGLINWSLSSRKAYDFIRALTKPYPGAFSFIDNKRVLIWEASWCVNDVSTGGAGTVSSFRYGFIPNQCSVLVNCREGLISINKIELDNGELLSGEALIGFFEESKGLGFTNEA